ncbi:MAG: type II toxin-antitoxin system VapC family toxin [Symploca sp. SIO2C1]|nr:type II toxin-antitoxin system VapC family toxin [Symploca sp. SIO2C1]
MSFLVDTNVLLRSIDSSHSMNAVAVTALTTLRKKGEQLYITSQNLIEFWNVYTRPMERNGLGGTPQEAEAEIRQLKAFFPLLLDTTAIYPQWERLVIAYAVSGVKVHDTRLVATMLVHGLTHILTFNSGDFVRFSEITAVHPTTVTVEPNQG